MEVWIWIGWIAAGEEQDWDLGPGTSNWGIFFNANGCDFHI